MWSAVVFRIVSSFFLLLIATPFLNAERKRYDNHHVYQFQARNQSELQFFQSLDGNPEICLFLTPPYSVNVKINVIVPREHVTGFEDKLKSVGIQYLLLESDAQSKLNDDEEVADPNRRGGEYSWRQYHELNDTYNWIRSLAERYPKVVNVFVAGQSYEGRELLGIKISYGTKEKKAIFLEGGMHAREWISPAVTSFIADQLLTNSHKDVRLIAENFDWYIVPHANPDGYVYTHTTDRLWRKTRTPYGRCDGADPNRNWDFHWNEVGTSTEPCYDTYAGPKAFSEIEVRTLAQYISKLKGKLFLYVSFHSYSQLLMYPYGHTSSLPPNNADLKRVYNAAIAGISRRYGTKYTGGNIYDAIYPASGASIDWVYAMADVKYTYCYELRPSSFSSWTGFKLPAAQIIPTGLETLDSLIEMIREAAIKRDGPLPRNY